MHGLPIDIPEKEIVAFCQRWDVMKLELFGSVLRDDFGPESDVDLLATFGEAARPSLFDLVTMQNELISILGRHVDLIDRRSVDQSHNWVRRTAILSRTQPVYQAA